jgi:cbb3-type cytochrome oxidase subunit 3
VGYTELGRGPMSEETNRKPFSGFRNPLLYTSTLLLIALVYVGGTFYMRREQNREIEKRAADAAAAKERTNDAQTVEQLGGTEFKILNFYATPGLVHPNETVQLCYGVSNAKTVKLEPQTNFVWPSVSRCVDVNPKKTTDYTLTIEDGNGNSKTSTLTVLVR